MAYCIKCGANVDDDALFCPLCGGEIPRQQNRQENQKENRAEQHTYQQGEYFDTYEVKQNKGMGVLSYFGILVVIPLLAGDRNSQYVRHHVNQGLMLFIISSIIDLLNGRWIWKIHTWFDFGGNMLSRVFDVADLACFVLMIVGIVTACKGEKRELPIIGKYKFLK